MSRLREVLGAVDTIETLLLLLLVLELVRAVLASPGGETRASMAHMASVVITSIPVGVRVLRFLVAGTDTGREEEVVEVLLLTLSVSLPFVVVVELSLLLTIPGKSLLLLLPDNNTLAIMDVPK